MKKTKDPIKSPDGTSMHPFIRSSQVFYNGHESDTYFEIPTQASLNVLLDLIIQEFVILAEDSAAGNTRSEQFTSTGTGVQITHNLGKTALFTQVVNSSNQVVNDAAITFNSPTVMTVTVPAGNYFIYYKA